MITIDKAITQGTTNRREKIFLLQSEPCIPISLTLITVVIILLANVLLSLAPTGQHIAALHLSTGSSKRKVVYGLETNIRKPMQSEHITWLQINYVYIYNVILSANCN